MRLVASITVFPSQPLTVSNTSATAPPGTATRTTSASDTSPPSLPMRVTSCPARSQQSASPPPTFPFPTTAIFMTTPLVGFGNYSCVDAAYVEAMMRAALAEAEAAGEAGPLHHGRAVPSRLGAAVMADVPHIVFAHPDPAVQLAQIVEGIPYVAAHFEPYRGGVLRDESRALFERYEPRMLDWLDDRVVRHRQTPD